MKENLTDVMAEDEEPEIDGMERNIEDGFSEDPLADVFQNESKMLDGEKVEPVKEEVKEEEPAKIEEQKVKIETAEELAERIAGLNAALAAEREKKREAQQRVYELSQGRQQQHQEPVKREFDWTNPEKTIEGVKEELSRDMNTRILNMSEAQCQSRHEDYGEKYEVFKSMAMANPSIVNQMTNQPDPAEWAYRQAANQMSMQEMGSDPAAYKAKLTAEITASVIAQMQAGKINQIENKIQSVTGKLPPMASSIPGKTRMDQGPVVLDDPLGSIFGER
jgi:Neuraminidase (sialidase)